MSLGRSRLPLTRWNPFWGSGPLCASARRSGAGSENVKPIAGTDSCQTYHLGYVLSGRMRVFMDDGSEQEIASGSVFVIPPGHNAEVIGDEPCETLEFGQASRYAKRQ